MLKMDDAHFLTYRAHRDTVMTLAIEVQDLAKRMPEELKMDCPDVEFSGGEDAVCVRIWEKHGMRLGYQMFEPIDTRWWPDVKWIFSCDTLASPLDLDNEEIKEYELDYASKYMRAYVNYMVRLREQMEEMLGELEEEKGDDAPI